ncbi:conserved hypothetical protein [Solidesulfovibrio fructosivorans JJ]]|uniref:Uncharacterized protein n=1 Tax=Solidesulfovibrio fructosivorans JJ] TaxID=596151 RepID=E1JS42_SOLFR|nr:hypothetical protein [Solidesulfovibrio fructosivorans]EFL52811.1 conserved hypothetical protein [Solidesulfovibrio fructosivorans JJ]]
MADAIYQGDAGLRIVLDCGRDITAATAPAIMVRKPDGSTARWQAAITTEDGETRFLTYVVRDGDLAQSGAYRLQASLSLGDWSGRGKTALLAVLPPFAHAGMMAPGQT